MLLKNFHSKSGLKFPGHIKTGQGSILAEGSTLPESTLPIFESLKACFALVSVLNTKMMNVFLYLDEKKYIQLLPSIVR